MFTSATAHHCPISGICELWSRLEDPCYNARMPTFLVHLRRDGPRWDRSRPMEEQSDWDAHAAFMNELVDDGFLVLGGPLADEVRVAHVIEADSAEAVRETLARDPWSESHLVIDAIEPWTIRLDARGPQRSSRERP